MNWKFVPRPYHARDSIGAIVAGMVLYGLVNFVVGVYYIYRVIRKPHLFAENAPNQ